MFPRRHKNGSLLLLILWYEVEVKLENVSSIENHTLILYFVSKYTLSILRILYTVTEFNEFMCTYIFQR